MGKTALVLSGGGAKGAFQVGAEKYLREEKGYSWDIIGGVSVGALNGTMLAMEKYTRLEAIWKSICNSKVYSGKFNFMTLWKLYRGAKSIYSNDPLAAIIEREVEPEKIVKDLRIGTVSLNSGRYTVYSGDDPNIKRAVLASTVVPIVWPPQYVSSECQMMVDGSLRRFSPIGDVIDADPEEVVVINCWPKHPAPLEQPPRNILDIAIRALDISSSGIIYSDIHEFTQINSSVREAAEHGVTLHNVKGKPFKEYKSLIIEPTEHLGWVLDFSHETVERGKQMGWERAKEVAG
ncbi:patatin-like phospholipase family protein [bacterium]|nr:patatin-like phospholipase family protein [bacterium]